MVKLQIDHLTKHYWLEREDRDVLALSDVSFSVEDGEFMAIVGPSGCGKTSMLNIVAGLLPYERRQCFDRRQARRRSGNRPGRGIPACQPAAVAHHCWKRSIWHGTAAAIRRKHDEGTRRLLHQAGRSDRIRTPLSVRAFGWHAAARQPRQGPGGGSGGPVDGRTVRRARCSDTRVHAGRTAEDLGESKEDGSVHHASDQRSDLSGRSRCRDERTSRTC